MIKDFEDLYNTTHIHEYETLYLTEFRASFKLFIEINQLPVVSKCFKHVCN